MKHAKKKATNLLPLWISLGAVFVVLVIFYLVAANYFSNHFGLNTSIDSINCTFMTVDEVEERISKSVNDYKLQVNGREGASKTISAADVGLTYQSDGQVWRVLNEQNQWLWFTRFFIDPNNSTTQASVRFNVEKFNQTLDSTDFYKDENMRPPVNAYALFKDGAYIVNPQDLGTTLDKDKTRQAIYDAIHGLAPNVYLDEKGCYNNPEIYADNAELKKTVETYNKYAPFSITYQFEDHTEVLDGSTTMNWIIIDEQGNGTLNEDALEAWVREFGIKHDTVGSKREFVTASGETITVEGGNYGWEVDEDAEILSIKNAFANRLGEVREPHYVQRAEKKAEPGKPDWGNNYIELDLTKQHMYYFVDGKIEMEADVVTGSPGRNATPPGVYNILQMSSPATLVGEIMSNGKPEYRTRVSFWMRITWAGHGFHDATWQPWFGGNRYTFSGSHGCINMSYSDAQKLYGLIHEGLPVISHA